MSSDIRGVAMKPSDRVIWLRSPGRSFLTGWRVERIPGVVERVWRRRVGIRVRLDGIEKLAVVDPDNLLPEECNRAPASSPERSRMGY